MLLLHSDGEVLSGQEIVGQWQLDQRMLAEGGTYYRRHGGRIQVVKADSAKLDISIAVAMQGYGGFGKIAQAHHRTGAALCEGAARLCGP